MTTKLPLKDMRAIVNHLYWQEYENYRETHKLDSTPNETTSHARGGVDHIFCNIVRVVDWLRKEELKEQTRQLGFDWDLLKKWLRKKGAAF
jgi:hypothetical protein